MQANSCWSVLLHIRLRLYPLLTSVLYFYSVSGFNFKAVLFRNLTLDITDDVANIFNITFHKIKKGETHPR